MSIMKSIIAWDKDDLSDWKSDAVRRLLTQSELSEKDTLEIMSMLKDNWGLNNDETITPKRLQKSDIPSFEGEEIKITLKSMSKLHNVNAIPDESKLVFGHDGLTVIYGENGAGKSGYARVMKRACKARDSKEHILSNVFQSDKKGIAKAEFKFSMNDELDENVIWKDNEDIESQLSYINVFDSRSATIIVDGNNEVIYLPNGAHVFEGLVNLIKDIKERLNREKPLIKTLEYKDIGENTTAWKIIAELSDKTEEGNIKEFAVWSDGDKRLVDKIKKEMAELELHHPEKEAKKIRDLRKSLITVKNRITSLQNTLSAEKGNELNILIQNYKAAKKASEQIVQENNLDLPLEGFQNNEWQILYNAAKEFSIKTAYKGQEYPVKDEKSRCVLCMQSLSESAKDRFTYFKEFMENNTKRQEEIVLNKIEEVGKVITEAEILSIELIEDVLGELEDRKEGLKKRVKSFITLVEHNQSVMKKAINSKQQEEFTATESKLECDLQEVINELENEVKDKEKSKDPEKIKGLKDKLSELEAKRIFTQRKDDILSYLKQVKKLHKYDGCISDLKTASITRKGNKIVSSNLTPILKQTLETEIKSLGANHLLLNLKSSGSGGETRHQIQLQENQSNAAKLSDVLSEGEQQIVALSGFFAELELGKHECPIVLDDPVSSLDHRYREKIARRLVKESLKRQVIVFTHDISLLLSLERNSGEMGSSFTPHTLNRASGIVGNVSGGNPWHTMGVSKRIGYLKSELNSFKKYYQTDSTIFNRQASHLYGLLRETWEALIEKDLLNEAIYRHSDAVQTKRLQEVEVTTEDYKKIDINMGKCSTWMTGHDKSVALDIDRPSPSEVLEDIIIIENYSREIVSRRKKLKKERSAALKPKKTTVG